MKCNQIKILLKFAMIGKKLKKPLVQIISKNLIIFDDIEHELKQNCLKFFKKNKFAEV